MTVKSQISADLSAIFTDGLQTSITHKYNNGANQETLNAFFEHPYQTALSEGRDAESSLPSILLKTGDTANITRQSEFIIEGETYYIIEKESNVEGITRINLSKTKVYA